MPAPSFSVVQRSDERARPLLSECLSVRLSVCHTRDQQLNGLRYPNTLHSARWRNVSNFFRPNFPVQYLWVRPTSASKNSVSGQPHSNWWWCHDVGYPLLAAEHSLCTAPWSGTPCRTTSAHSRTTSPLDRAWKPGFSLDTSVFSALETSWKCAI